MSKEEGKTLSLQLKKWAPKSSIIQIVEEQLMPTELHNKDESNAIMWHIAET